MQQNTEVSLESCEFHHALCSYLEAEKLDKVITAQAKNLSLEWHQSALPSNKAHGDTSVSNNEPFDLYQKTSTSPTQENSHSTASRESEASLEEKCFLQGRLCIANEYISVCIEARVLWRYWRSQQCSAYKEEKKGFSSLEKTMLQFKLSVWAELISDDQNKSIPTQKALKQDMKKRLQKNSYIQKLLSASSSKNNNNTSIDEVKGIQLCEAIICQEWKAEDCRNSSRVVSPSTEERVDVSEAALEGVRRSIFSQSDCNLTVLEILLSMPWLAHRSRVHTTSSGWDAYLSKSTATMFNKNALYCACDRASLRLLEDALVDACEREGEEEIIEDLTLKDRADGNLFMHNEDGKTEKKGSARTETPTKRKKPKHR